MSPSGVQCHVMDLVEHNITFRVTSPDGKSFFGWYPLLYKTRQKAMSCRPHPFKKPLAG